MAAGVRGAQTNVAAGHQYALLGKRQQGAAIPTSVRRFVQSFTAFNPHIRARGQLGLTGFTKPEIGGTADKTHEQTAQQNRATQQTSLTSKSAFAAQTSTQCQLCAHTVVRRTGQATWSGLQDRRKLAPGPGLPRLGNCYGNRSCRKREKLAAFAQNTIAILIGKGVCYRTLTHDQIP